MDHAVRNATYRTTWSLLLAFGAALTSGAACAKEGAAEAKLDPSNYWFSSYSQGLGIMSTAAWDAEANLNGVGSRFSGLGQPATRGSGLQTAQISLRRQISSFPGLDVGAAVGGSYVTQGDGNGGDVPSRGLSEYLTAHYATKLFKGLGAGAYGQIGAAQQRTGPGAWTGSSVVSITPVLAWEPEDSVVSSIALNPVAAGYMKSGELTQGPMLKNVTDVGGNVGAGFNLSEQLVLMPEVSYLRSHGSALESSAQSGSSDTYRAGIVATFSYAGEGVSRMQTKSVSFGIWYYEEDGRISGPNSPASPSGRFVTKGAIVGATFGGRRN